MVKGMVDYNAKDAGFGGLIPLKESEREFDDLMGILTDWMDETGCYPLQMVGYLRAAAKEFED